MTLMDTKAVLDHHFAAYTAGDADDTLNDYTEAAGLITPEEVYKGRGAIHGYFSRLFSGLFKPGTYDFGLDRLTIEGEVAYVVWHATCATARISLATDTWVVRDGKIVAQTYAAKIDPR
jgi:ketosteroid isomerase-like protein